MCVRGHGFRAFWTGKLSVDKALVDIDVVDTDENVYFNVLFGALTQHYPIIRRVARKIKQLMISAHLYGARRRCLSSTGLTHLVLCFLRLDQDLPRLADLFVYN